MADENNENKVEPAEEQGIKKPETSEEIEQGMEEGKKEENVYSEEGREKLAEDDEIEPFEEGFMEGAEGRGKKNSCAECGAQIAEDDENIVEREINGEVKVFCSAEHAENYAANHPEEEKPERVEE
ncbi:hypothetical protein GOV06_05520 [Candidatus Woesearchaeota archaeon]|nr:hypothetical protein [Candidatus Woesearchaeota archaeon]